MATFKCPDCGKKISLDAQACPKCGRVVTEQDRQANVKKPTSLWKKILNFAVLCLILFGMAKCYWADKQEARAFNREMTAAITEVVELNAKNLNLITKFGQPTCDIDFAGLGPSVWIDFPTGPMTNAQAKTYSTRVCHRIALSYAARGKPATTIRVRVRTAVKGATGKDMVNIYGVATYQSSNDSITWTPEG